MKREELKSTYEYQENIQFCRQARGSFYELMDHMADAFAEDTFSGFREKTTKVIKILNGYINYLQKQKKLA